MLQLHPTLPGGWLVVSAADTVLAVNTTHSNLPSAASILDAVGSGIQAAVETLTAEGLASAPAFALLALSPTGGVRVLLRGDVQVSLLRVEVWQNASGVGVQTWLEQSFDDATAFRIELGDVSLPIADDQLLPLETGAMWADYVSGGVVGAKPIGAAQNDASPIGDTTVVSLPDPEDADPAGAYDHLFGETVSRSVEDAAVRVGEPADHVTQRDSPPTDLIVPPARTVDELSAELDERSGDHDGLTVMSGDLQKLRRGQSRTPTAVSPPAPPDRFFLELHDGSTESLDRTLLVGRAPSVTKASGTEVPRLLTVDTDDHDISRNHVRLTIEGDTVVVTDLHSRNGTTVVLPGKTPQKLRQGEPTSVVANTIVDLGGGITMTVRRVDQSPPQ